MRRRSPPAANHSRAVVGWGIDAYDGMWLGTIHQWLEGTANFETEVTSFLRALYNALLAGLFDAQSLGHFLVEKAFALPVGLDPFAVNNELGDGALTGALDHFVRGSGRVFDIDFIEWNAVLLQEVFGFAALGAPGAGINSYFHRDI